MKNDPTATPQTAQPDDPPIADTAAQRPPTALPLIDERAVAPGRLALLTILACLMATPFVWMILTSLKPLDQVGSERWLPSTWRFDNYSVVLGLQKPEGSDSQQFDLAFGRWYFNSLFVAGWVTFIQIVVSALSAYAFSRLTWPGRDRLFLVYIGTMMIPGMVLVVPTFTMMVELHLVNTYLGLILPPAFSAFGTFLLRQTMLTLPRSLDEAAKLDGAGHFRILLDVLLPLCRPALITLAAFVFVGNYMSFFWPLIMIRDSDLHTLPIGMLYFDTLYSRQTNLLMAASVMNILPAAVIFIALQKTLVRGIQFSALRS
jgi:ABC-type glycerol-3-phosphate transport system permease component